MIYARAFEMKKKVNNKGFRSKIYQLQSVSTETGSKSTKLGLTETQSEPTNPDR